MRCGGSIRPSGGTSRTTTSDADGWRPLGEDDSGHAASLETGEGRSRRSRPEAPRPARRPAVAWRRALRLRRRGRIDRRRPALPPVWLHGQRSGLSSSRRAPSSSSSAPTSASTTSCGRTIAASTWRERRSGTARTPRVCRQRRRRGRGSLEGDPSTDHARGADERLASLPAVFEGLDLYFAIRALRSLEESGACDFEIGGAGERVGPEVVRFYSGERDPDGDALRHIVIRETHWDHDGSPNDDMTISVPGAAPQPAAGAPRRRRRLHRRGHDGRLLRLRPRARAEPTGVRDVALPRPTTLGEFHDLRS